MMRRLTIAAALVLFLSACGGGGGGGSTTSMLDTDMARDLTGAAPPIESAGDQSARAPSIISRADSLIISTEDIRITARYGIVGGDLTATRPTGSATWRGIMLGMTASGAGRGERLQGDASLVCDLAASDLDISFSGIQNLDRRRAHSTSSVRFDDVPVTLGGTFEAGLTGNRVQGGFYGPGHAEAAGVFEQSNIVGAFGATR